ncbi:MAG: MFS transporter [Actinomycetia bacterium]|nr:MFS transporter [Actinomycetes bacterium]
MSRTFSSLAFPSYRRYFTGVTASNIGMWMTRTAQSWVVLVELTAGDAQALGWLTAIMFVPTLALTPVAGSVSDRFPKRTVMLVAQLFLLVDIVTLSVLSLSGALRLWHVFALATMDGVASAFDAPCRQAIVSEMVPPDKVSNAIGLNSTSFNAARLLGPGAAGILIAAIGSGWVFVVNAVTYLVHICCLLRLQPSQMTATRAPDRRSGSLLVAVRYVAKRPDLALLLTIAAGMGAFGFNFSITNPLMSTEVFGKGAGEFGALGSVMGIGSLTAALLAARRRRPRLRHVAVALGLFAGLLAVSAMSPSFWFFTLLMVPLGWTSVQVMVTANALIQVAVAPEFRGRVMALWTAMILGLTPVVSPVLGVVGAYWGARATVWACAGGMIALFVGVSLYLAHSPGVEVHMTRRRPWVSVEPRSTGR